MIDLAAARRGRAGRLAPLVAAALLLVASVARAAGVEAVASVGLPVADLARSVAFFTSVLDFELASETELDGEAWERLEGVFPVRMRVATLRLGAERITLTQYLAPRGRAVPEDFRSDDRAFQHLAIVVSDMDRAYAKLRAHAVSHVSSGPQRLPDWNPDAGGIRAFYFRDPDDHVLELIQFPPGKGDPRWQRAEGRLFLGIDHTAIVVSDTEASLRFYRDLLGLRVAGESTNSGPEQERLNAVRGARLRITSLRAPAGPGVELLEYLAPGGGRPRPAELHANDLLAWQTRLVTGDPAALEAALAAQTPPRTASERSTLPASPIGFREAFLAADPDGHALLITDGAAAR